MNYRIWKYTLEITDHQKVPMPQCAKILSVANQNGHPCLWAMVDADRPIEQRAIEIIGTGNPVAQVGVDERKFIGTVVIHPFVWHVFERV